MYSGSKKYLYFKSLIFIIYLPIVGCFNERDGDNSSSNSTATGVGVATATINWTANRDQAVNSPKGGYRVYYSKTTPVDTNQKFVTVEYDTVSGSTPTSVAISISDRGQYYFAVQAFSGVSIPDGGLSILSTEFTLNIQ